jgi:hypothetical protein
MSPQSAPADSLPIDAVSLTLRLPAPLHAELKQMATRRQRSLNSMIVEAVQFAMTPPGGASLIAKARRDVGPRGRAQARAAAAYILAYVGEQSGARRLWPWQGRLTLAAGDPSYLPAAGAHIAAEIDRVQAAAARPAQ